MEPTMESATTEPDLMNDPALDADIAGKEEEDPDTCRICRGEASATTPLFYPCKCSGSIKFVHQDCLMEWLSHSQKKHCELCKTSFRFTKLYHPQMPSSVPLPIFLKQAGVHAFNSLLTWLRWNLVVFVWLGWVPWCMRTVWRGLFWIGDGGWITAKEIERQATQTNLERLAARGTSPAIQGLPPPANLAGSTLTSTTTATISSVWRPFIYAANATNPFLNRVVKHLYAGFIFPNPHANTTKPEVMPPSYDISHRPDSLLSGVGFLKNLTRSSMLNNLAIDIVEGQFITIAMVVIFILIFLIREWVVQQQPAINAGIGLAEIQNQIAVREQPEANPPPANDRPAQDRNNNAVPRRIRPMPMMRAPQNALQQDRQQGGNEHVPVDDEAQVHQPREEDRGIQTDIDSPTDSNGDIGESSTRPTLPHREIFGAGEIRRTLEEQAVASGEAWPGLDTFMDVWNRAGKDPDAVLRMIQEEGREEELAWIVTAMRKLQSRQSRFREALPDVLFDKPDSNYQSSNSSESWSVLDQATSGSNPDLPIENDIGSGATDAETPTQAPPLVRHESNRSSQLESSVQHPQEESAAADPSQLNSLIREINEQTFQLPQDPIVDSATAAPAPDDLDLAPTVPEGHGATTDTPEQGGTEQAVSLQTFTESLLEWFWGEVPDIAIPNDDNDDGNDEDGEDNIDEDDGHVVEDIEGEQPFVPIAQGQPVVRDAAANQNAEHQDDEVLRAAAEAGIDPNDPEAVDDAEDLEGVLELIGMQGPIAGLIQNGMFSAVLISMALLCGIWVPYLAGKATLVFFANPVAFLVKLPLKWASTAADTIVDTCIFFAGWAFCWIDVAVRFLVTPVGWLIPFVRNINKNKVIPQAAWKWTWEAAERLRKSAVASGLSFSESDVPVFSVVAHESLVRIRTAIARMVLAMVGAVASGASFISSDSSITEKIGTVSSAAAHGAGSGLTVLKDTASAAASAAPSIMKSNPLRIKIDIPERTQPLDYSLANWSAQDRILTILFGYFFFFLSGAIYLKIKERLRGDSREKNEGAFVDLLNQAGGVTKVILIISIEMIAFPLYCGMLLDVALLPLFRNATVSSRIAFTANSPFTSIFVHWFVGTCYMFHFALFVSMCRKIMRTGVLYFIRDPDDPSFHPVRDVLERNVYTQLRKIAFSAMVYGGLVMICLGMVVWGISFTSRSIFPIHWSSSEPVLDFPVDLLAYNFLMPLAIKYFRPSKGLNTIYGWWFRKCASRLRLTYFLFGERRPEEEGPKRMVIRKGVLMTAEMAAKAAAEAANVTEDAEAAAMTEEAKINLKEIEDALKAVRAASEKDVTDTKNEQKKTSTVPESGRFVRAPASDQVRLPKGSRTFVEIDEEGNRLDGKADTDQGIHGRNNAMFSMIYIPPNFRLRIAAFIGLLWLFAAATGVGVTIIPLLFGRAIFDRIIPSPTGMNDIYAFALGTYLLGGPIYLLIRYRRTLSSLRLAHLLPSLAPSLAPSLFTTFFSATLRTTRLLYFYTAFAILIPSLVALVFEAYVLIPLHTYSLRHVSPTPPHTVHFAQDWTLGVLALKLAARILLAHPTTPPARALRALVSPSNKNAGWLDPDVRLATRAFVLPVCVVLATALSAPWGLARAATAVVPWLGKDTTRLALVYRYAYPTTLGAGLLQVGARTLYRAMGRWRARIRDEVYLIGERLHNFGERKGRVGSGGRVAVR